MHATAFLAAAQRTDLPIAYRQARLDALGMHLDIFFQRHDS
jgi:hypothetical protein